MSHVKDFFLEAAQICNGMETSSIDRMVTILKKIRETGGRLFLIGVGGSAGNCSHAVNDFRKLCGIEAYSPIDNVSELTARTNDEGWESVFSEWLKISRLNKNDAIFVLSVGGGDAEKNISVNIVKAVDLAKEVGAKVLGIVGKSTGHTAKNGDAVVVIPPVNPSRVTPLSEGFQAVVWHCLVSHPELQKMTTKW